MKKLILLFAVVVIIQSITYSQGSLPEGITFTTQAQIDNFKTNYAGCTKIDGSVRITGNDITNLNGLSTITSIGDGIVIVEDPNPFMRYSDSIIIAGNPNLINLSGLENLTSVTAGIAIYNNINLTSLTGLEGLHHIEGTLSVGRQEGEGNPALTSLNGLNNLATVKGDLCIISNNTLTNLNGLERLNWIGGSLFIFSSPAMNSLNALQNLDSIGWCLDLYKTNLTNLTGLNHLTSIGATLSLSENNALINLSGLEGLTSIPEDLWIENNPKLTNLTGFGRVTFIGSDTILAGGDVAIIGNTSLISLAGLEALTTIGGNLMIADNDNLPNLTGLDNVSFIEHMLSLNDNDGLTSLAGLGNLKSIGWDIGISRNPSLKSLTALKNLKSISGILGINSNGALTSLDGLENIPAGSIAYLDISDNTSLSTCEIKSICDYLAGPDASVTIQNNAPGCNSVEEVKAACAAVGVWAVGNWQPEVGSFPNPFSNIINIEYTLEKYATVNLAIFNLYGQEVKILVNEPQPGGTHLVQWNAGGLPEGIYFYRLQADNRIILNKILKIQ